MSPRPSIDTVIRVTAAVAAPAAIALFVLWAAGELSAAPAAIAGAFVFVVSAALIYRHLGDLGVLRSQVDDLEGVTVFDGAGREGSLLSGVGTALRRVRREWQQRSASTRAQLMAGESIIDSLPDPMLVIDDRMRVVRINVAARLLFGRDVSGRELAGLLRHPQVLDVVQQTIDDGGEHEAEFTLPDIVDRAFNARTKALAERPDDGSAMVLTLHDLTEVKRSDQLRADFVANASHELRTPLSALIGFIETLRGPAADDSGARDRFLGIMQEQALRMSRLIADLLSLSRIELNEHARPTGRVDLGDITRRVADSLELRATARDVTIDIEGDSPAVVRGDADELEQVVQNLVDNAIKYGRHGGRVTVSISRGAQRPRSMNRVVTEEGVVALAVKNEGDGIAPDQLPRLTERFYRVDTARSRELGGTGLGLAIVKHIVNRHRGALTIESAPGRGATFIVYLAAADRFEPAMSGSESAAA